MGMMNPNLYQPSCPKRTFKQPIFASMDVSLSHDVNYLDCSLEGSVYTWEGQLGDVWMEQHLDPCGVLSYEDATGGEEKVLQSYLCSCLRTSNI